MGTYELNIILHYNVDQNKNKKTKQNREKKPTKTNKM